MQVRTKQEYIPHLLANSISSIFFYLKTFIRFSVVKAKHLRAKIFKAKVGKAKKLYANFRVSEKLKSDNF